jgi:alkaline phosphatase D
VLTGDIHNNWAGDLKQNFDNPSSPTLGVEFVATSISSGGDGFDTNDSFQALLAQDLHIDCVHGPLHRAFSCIDCESQ